MTAPGPGVTLLAQLTGRDPEQVATSAGTALRALAELAREVAHLAVDQSSPDDAVRQDAQRRAADLTAAVEAVPAPTAGAARARFEERLETALTALLHDLRQEPR